MKREIKFRGLRTDGKGWVYGDIATYWTGAPMIMPKCYFASSDLGDEDENGKAIIGKELAIGGFVYVIPETVGQYTGLKDKDGKEIYEGDIIQIQVGAAEVVWGEFKGKLKGFPDHCDELEMVGWCVKHDRLGIQPLDDSFYENYSIIGNIHEHKHLLK